MKASEIYHHETGRESHTRAGFPNVAYVEWLEAIAVKAAEIEGVAPTDGSFCRMKACEELRRLIHGD